MVCSILFISGCTLFEEPFLQPVSPSFQFTEDKTQTGLVAFSVVCKGVNRTIKAEVTDVKTNNFYLFNFVCDPQEAYRQIKILKIPAGYYTFSRVEYSDGNTTHFTSEKNHFYFNIKAHKLNYIGRIQYTIGGNQILTAVSNEDIEDLPEIKMSLPEISVKDYVVLFWGRDEFGEFGDVIAK